MSVGRRLAAITLGVVLVLGPGGCGNPQRRYCEALRENQSRLDEMIGSKSAGALLLELPLLEQLGAKAPDDLTDEWQTFLNAVKGLRDALKQAGVRTSDFGSGKIPDRVVGADRRTLVAAADELSSAGVVDAAKGIETQARDVCKVNLGV